MATSNNATNHSFSFSIPNVQNAGHGIQSDATNEQMVNITFNQETSSIIATGQNNSLSNMDHQL